MQTHIRLSLEKKSNQGLHCLQFCQYLSLALFYSKTFWFIFAWLQQCLRSRKTLEYYSRHLSKIGFNATFINLKSALTYTTLLTDGLLNSFSRVLLSTKWSLVRSLVWRHTCIHNKSAAFFIPPANFVCGGYTVFTLSVRPSVRLSVRNALFPWYLEES